MQTALPSEFRRGMVVMVDNAPHIIEDLRLSGTAQTKHKLHCKLRNLRNGRVFERVFGDTERVTVLELEQRRVQFSYLRGDTYVFTDSDTFEELELTKEQIGDRKLFLKDDLELKAMFLDGKLLDIVMPGHVTLKVIETAPPQKGGSDSAWKAAKLESGLEIMVPLFVGVGDLIRVDTQERKYLGKESH